MLLLAALLGGAPVDPSADTIQYRQAEAVVVDKNGNPLFRAKRDFLLQVAGNPAGKVLAYDSVNRRVLVSDHNPWWITCDQLQPQAVACAMRRQTRGGASRGPMPGLGEEMARGLPSCPGDPRCPKGGG